MVQRAYIDIVQGKRIDTYARSAFEDHRRNAARFSDPSRPHHFTLRVLA
jgi:hypothetical protein